MKNKLIVEIAEGLGNQLFMYAYAFALSKEIDYDLYIDNASGYSKKKATLRKHQKYMLDNFNINQIHANPKDRYDNTLKRFKKKIELFFEKYFVKKKFITEKYIKINGKKIALKTKTPNKINLSKKLYIQGHFEDHNYFKSQRGDILSMYKPLTKFLNNNNDIISKLKNSNSVSIHVRQNRFSDQNINKLSKVNNQKSLNFTNELIDYIKKSIIYFETNIKNPEFFIWSNDFSNLKYHFNEAKYNYVTDNDVINDFNLFSYAKHFIVGASTFHWWGAWLNENPSKICVCPYNLSPSGNDNFYPVEWKRI